MKGIFVTGTDTGVGKTVITGLLARYLISEGRNVVTQKWVQTGCPDFSSTDIVVHLKIMGRSRNDIHDYLGDILPYRFNTASSPHLACCIEGRRINPVKIIKSFRVLSSAFDFVIVEGAGGALVPFDKNNLLVDIARKLGLDVLIVVQNKLGAINHTLLTIEALRARKMRILGVVFNNTKVEKRIVVQDNPVIVKALSRERVFGVLPWKDGFDRLYKDFIPIGERICKALKMN